MHVELKLSYFNTLDMSNFFGSAHVLMQLIKHDDTALGEAALFFARGSFDVNPHSLIVSSISYMDTISPDVKFELLNICDAEVFSYMAHKDFITVKDLVFMVEKYKKIPMESLRFFISIAGNPKSPDYLKAAVMELWGEFYRNNTYNPEGKYVDSTLWEEINEKFDNQKKNVENVLRTKNQY
jgi:hypothetical protein